MPSPVAHSIVGLALGLARFLPRGLNFRQMGRQIWKLRLDLLFCVVLACASDIDYLLGAPYRNLHKFHQRFTHTLGWLALVAVVIWGYGWLIRRDQASRAFWFIGLLLCSHLVLDYLGEDHSYPFGIMMFWPFSDRDWLAPVPLFISPAKQSWHAVWTGHNLWVGLEETLVTLPLLALVLIWKCRAPSKTDPLRQTPDIPLRPKDG